MRRVPGTSICMEHAIAPTEVCVVCGLVGDAGRLGVWYVENARSLIHADCWLAEYQAGNLHTAEALGWLKRGLVTIFVATPERHSSTVASVKRSERHSPNAGLRCSSSMLR
jgi:hypothetical protein